MQDNILWNPAGPVTYYYIIVTILQLYGCKNNFFLKRSEMCEHKILLGELVDCCGLVCYYDVYIMTRCTFMKRRSSGEFAGLDEIHGRNAYIIRSV